MQIEERSIMIGKNERQRDIIKVIEKLDITPSMYKNADEKYHALAEYVSKHTDLKLNMYPQGSFAFGTVIRPFKNDAEGAYDLDFICEVDFEKSETTPEELRNFIENAVSEGELYGGKLEVSDECLTIKYAEEGGAQFSIDIVPATRESASTIAKLKEKTIRPDLIDSAIAIPMKEKDNYLWKTNNPKGLMEWFSEINEPYKMYSRTEFRKSLFESTKFYDKIEDIPEGMERSSVQRVIQLLKRHRDLYYNSFPDLKPISAIINVFVTSVARCYDPSTDVFTLLEYVLEELNESSKYYSDRTKGEILLENRVIARKNKEWYIANPANPEDNLADAWNESEDIPHKFFKWISVAKEDFVDSMEISDNEFKAIVESALGRDAVGGVWGEKYDSHKSIPIIASSKPWRK